MRIRPPGAQQLGAAVQEPGRQAADADVAVREQHRSPPAPPGQWVEYRTVQGGRPSLAHPGHRSRRDVHAKGRNAPLGQRYGQPSGAAAHVEDGPAELRVDTAHTVPEPPEVGSLVPTAPSPPTISRRGVLGFAGAGSLLLIALSVGQSIGGLLRRTTLLAPHGQVTGSGRWTSRST
jgi:hypothetical protein